MKQIVCGLVLLATAGAATGNATPVSAAPLDIAGVTAVVISGEAGSVVITTAADEPYQATVRRHRPGWFGLWNSSWAFDACDAAGRMWIEGSLLRIDVGSRAWFGMSDCSYDINLNIPKQAAVRIDQQALQASLVGDFSAVTMAAKAADFRLSGHADSVSLKGDALRVGLTFETIAQNEVVTIDSRMLEADLDFAVAPSLAYFVTAKASFVSSARPSTPGAKPSLTITGELVHATIR